MLAVAFYGAAGCALALLGLLLSQRRITTRLRRRNAVLEDGERGRDEELRHLITARLPAVAESLYGRRVEVPGPLHPRTAGIAYGQGLETVTGMFAEFGDMARGRADEAAKATLKSMMRGVQSLANEQQLAISRMQDRHDDPDVLDGLLRIDHMNAQLGRRAQATAVLCGSWPGQQRSSSPLVDVVRGATSRIRDYLRIQVNPQVNVAVVSRVVEPVVLAVAELLDNAARHSQPGAPVEVNFQPSHNGMAIVIDDAGIAMTAEEQHRATRLLSGEESVDINRLGDPPQIGFALIGVLTARYGFSVSVDTRSPYGGVRAVVFLPSSLLTQVDPRASIMRTAAATDPRPSAPAEGVPDSPATALTVSGLPRRRRASPLPQDPEHDRPAARAADREDEPVTVRDGGGRGPAPDDTAGPPARAARRTAAGLGAWQRGTRSGRATVPPDSEGDS